MRRPVDQVVCQFLESKSLPREHFAQLNEMVGRAAFRTPPVQDSGGRRRYWGGVAVVVALVVLVVAQFRAPVPPAEIHQYIADEVAINHTKLKALEIRSDDISEVRRFFEPLGFKLTESRLFENTLWQMIGGRFCTIRGQVAAQLRMRDPGGKVQTVYQASYSPEAHREIPDIMRSEDPIKLYSQGLEVQLWRERGLLFAAVSQ